MGFEGSKAMSEGNLLDQQQHHHQQNRNLFSSSRDSELELLERTTATSSPEIRSRSQSVGSAHQEALLFFEQHRLFQNSPELDFGREDLHGDCELRSISSTSRTSSPAIAAGTHQSQHYTVNTSDKPNYQQRQQKSGNRNLSQHSEQVQHRHKKSGLRQQSDSNLLCSSGCTAAGASFLDETANDKENQTNNSHDSTARGGRARSQSQGQCGSLRRRQDSCSSAIIVSTANKTGNDENGCGDGTQKASKWLEEIQFKAQYQHYRTNNYASVVSSASSLDKTDGAITSAAFGTAETGVTGLVDQSKYTSQLPTSSSTQLRKVIGGFL